MNAFELGQAGAIRLGFFAGVFVLVAVCELLAPRRVLNTSKMRRWITNLGITFLNTAILRVVLPAGALGMAVLAQERNWGILNNVHVPYAWAVAATVVAMDFTIYLQHVMFHAVPVLWRLHKMHHADLDFDLTTGTRFHPIEMILSMGIKIGVVALLGAPTLGVLVFEILLNATAMFNHGNLRLPLGVDRVLRWLVVTPDMHRVHHSIIREETDSNYGFNLPWWDRLLGTYRAQPAVGHDGMTIGLEAYRDPKRVTFWRLLVLPFVREPRES
jgi:sterol desaturase/sphingolipid hydroxylase (fatty acid hydroxylase superfamily)